MSQPEEKPKGDPWHAFGYITAGVACYGLLGWLADRWLDTTFLVAVGILTGAALGIYLTAKRFSETQPPPRDASGSPNHDSPDQQ